ncbi:MAG: hypothetical protein C6I01_06255 [Epsilonproteobacteria bacterium]|nr:hypothetical protein [Campylobacterota bacterium]
MGEDKRCREGVGFKRVEEGECKWGRLHFGREREAQRDWLKGRKKGETIEKRKNKGRNKGERKRGEKRRER